MAHRLTYWEDKNITIEESKKYSSRTEFCKNSYGAYRVSKKNGWLDEMVWLNRKNVYKDPVDKVYRYYFKNENAVYIGRTIYLELRDHQHRTRKKDTVYKFAKEHNTEIPEIEVLEEDLTVVQGAEKESYWEKYYRDKNFTIINKQPCGSLGLMCRGKWSKEKCFEEAKKYKTKSDFRKNNSYACEIATKKGWIKEMYWMHTVKQHPNGYWKDKNKILEAAKKYTSRTEFMKNNLAAYTAAHKYGVMDEITWFKKVNSLPFNYWKDKKHCVDEAKKYSSKTEFKKKNQSAYWASLKYGYLKEMPWLNKRKVTARGTFKNNKDLIIEKSKAYKTRGEFERHDKSSYNAALKYGWLYEMTWLKKGNYKPKGYWNDINNVIIEAKKYNTKKELKENNSYLYKLIFKKGYVDKLNWLK